MNRLALVLALLVLALLPMLAGCKSASAGDDAIKLVRAAGDANLHAVAEVELRPGVTVDTSWYAGLAGRARVMLAANPKPTGAVALLSDPDFAKALITAALDKGYVPEGFLRVADANDVNLAYKPLD